MHIGGDGKDGVYVVIVRVTGRSAWQMTINTSAQRKRLRYADGERQLAAWRYPLQPQVIFTDNQQESVMEITANVVLALQRLSMGVILKCAPTVKGG